MVQDEGLDGRQKPPHTPYKENLSLQRGKGNGSGGCPAGFGSLPNSKSSSSRDGVFDEGKKNFGLKNKAEVHEIRFFHLTKTLEIST